VFLTSRQKDAGLAAASQLGPQVRFVQLDVTNENSIRRAYQEVAASTTVLDLLINNAAVLEEEDRSVFDISTDMIQHTFVTNTIGPLLVTRTFLPLLRGAGCLCTMEHYVPAYSISKAALNAVTRQFAAACQADHIAVNAIDPGWVQTDMGGSQAPRTIKKGVEGIIWLATEAPSNLSGKFLMDQTTIRW
jgi:NAD(P)-dependent dehydrogenase (short-subunit alcohol dehydrogenase family)